MMRAITVTCTICAALALGACANDTLLGGLTPAAQPTAALPAKAAIDPACATLATRIDDLRKDGVVDRVEAAAKGKGKTVKVKRESLGQIAELEKANLEFQAKCSTLPRTAAAAPVKTAGGAPASEDAKAAALVAQATAASAKSTAAARPKAAAAAKAQ